MDEQKPKEQNDEQILPVAPSERAETINTNESATESDQTESPKPVDTSKLFAPDNPTPLAEEKPKKKISKKKVLFILILLATVGAVAWWFLVKKDPAPANSSQTANQQQATKPQSDFKTPDKVFYAFRENDADPFVIYSRPVNGGERKEHKKLNPNEYPNHFDTERNIVAYSTDEGIFVSNDGGSEFKKVYELKKSTNQNDLGEQITSIKINESADSLVFGLSSSPGEKNQVTEIGIDGSNKTTLFESESPGVFIESWNSSKMLYSEGCYNCDGNRTTPVIWDQKTNKSSILSQSITPGTVTSSELSSDGTSAIVSYGVEDKSSSEGLGVNIVAPYKVSRFDLASQTETVLTTIGKAGEKNPNGTVKNRMVNAGFLNQSNDVFYTDDSDFYTLTQTSANKEFTAENSIFRIHFANNELAIYESASKESQDFSLINYNSTNDTSAQILLGDANTIIFGVTTK